MNTWQQLVQQGVLGTARQPVALPLPPALAPLWQPVDGQATAAETRFLQYAAILTQYEAAGRLPMALETRPGLGETPVAAPETQPAVAEQPARLLQQLLADFDRKLVVEWLDHAAKQGAHLPHDTLPFLLDRATKERALATALVPCLGERGRWLITLNPAWQLAVAEPLDAAHWQAGTSEARLAFLQTLRREAPADAREALATVWHQEAATERAAFLATLRINLTAADQPFLEAALSDRSQSVRSAAAHLLTTLPTTPLRTALLTELTAYLKLERRWLRRHLVVTLPNHFREQWQAWGLREQSPLAVRIGQKAGWLVQLITLVPPSVLVAALGVDAVELLELIRASDYAEALLTALLEGAEHHQDYAFLLAELHHLLRLLALAQVQQSEFVERFARYAPLLPQAERATLLQRYLELTESRAFGDWTTLQMVLRHVDQVPPAVTAQLLTAQLPALLQRNTRDYGIGRILLDLAYQLAPAGYPHAEALFQRRQGEERPDYVDRFLQIYGLRHQIAQAFGR
jgi:hypothetical protein